MIIRFRRWRILLLPVTGIESHRLFFAPAGPTYLAQGVTPIVFGPILARLRFGAGFVIVRFSPWSNPMEEGSVQRLRVVARANDLFARLRDAGCERDRAGNRRLLYSHYASLVLLSLFNPAMQTLRGLQTASELRRVQKKLGTGRVSPGSLSESCRVFDPELLVPLIRELLAGLPNSNSGPGPRRTIPDAIPQDLARRLVAADGSTLAALPQIVRASTGGGPWKLHLQFRPLSGRPAAMRIAREYDAHELDVLADALAPNTVYLADRGYA